MAQNRTRRYECTYCIELFSTREECKAHPCYAVKNEKEDWSEDMIKLLISLYQEHEKKFEIVNIYQRKFLQVIAEIMQLQGYQDVTGDMCYNKWMGLRRLYMDEKTEEMSSKFRLRMAQKSGQTSNDSEFRSKFKYFDAMDSVLGKKPDIVGIRGGIDTSDPDSIENFKRTMLATEAAKRARRSAARESADLADSEDDELSTKLPYRYRAFLRRIDKKEVKAQRRHEEDQALRRESRNILRNIVNNKESACSTPYQANEVLDNAEDLRILDNNAYHRAILNAIPNIHGEERPDVNNAVDEQIEGMLEELGNIAPNFILNEDMVIDVDNVAAEVRDVLDDLSDGDMDVRTCLLKQFRLRKTDRRNNKQRRLEESQALISECLGLFQRIQLINKSA